MRYTIGTSFFDGPNSGSGWFFEHLWKPNVRRLYNSPLPPENVAVISVAGSKLPPDEQMTIIPLSGDLGHFHQFIGKKSPFKDNELSSWEASVIALAMIAYTNETDVIFLEQDCLAFGDWVGQLYRELNGRKMLFGNSRCMPCAQSLFIIKHDFILEFIRAYLNVPMGIRMGEDKFLHVQSAFPKEVGRFSFPFDRDRPLNYSLPVWYSQKNTARELQTMKSMKLIDYDELPHGVGKFTNDS